MNVVRSKSAQYLTVKYDLFRLFDIGNIGDLLSDGIDIAIQKLPHKIIAEKYRRFGFCRAFHMQAVSTQCAVDIFLRTIGSIDDVVSSLNSAALYVATLNTFYDFAVDILIPHRERQVIIFDGFQIFHLVRCE